MKYKSDAFLFVDAEEPKLMGRIESGVLKEIHLFGRSSMVGNIYRGYVKNVLPAMDCAFVDFGEGEAGYLPMKYVYPLPYRKSIKGGDTVIVEVKKMPLGDKRAVLSTDYSLRGEYLVLLPANRGVRISKKIEDDAARTRLKRWAEGLPDRPGLIVRTEAMACDADVLEREYLRLAEIAEAIEKERNFLPPTKRLRSDNLQASLFVRHPELPIVINDHAVEKYISDSYRTVYDPSFSLRGLAQYRKQFDELFFGVVPLPSGGNIVIDETEACVCIDVNSASVKKQGSFQAMRRSVNAEAMEACIAQILLRNISGMIVIDFLHGMDEEEKAEIAEGFRRGLADDPMNSTVYGFTAMGLFELSRQRREASFPAAYRARKTQNRERIKKEISREKKL